MSKAGFIVPCPFVGTAGRAAKPMRSSSHYGTTETNAKALLVQEELEAEQQLEEYSANRLDGKILHGYRTEEEEVDWAIPSSPNPLRAEPMGLSSAGSDAGSRQSLLASFEVDGYRS